MNPRHQQGRGLHHRVLHQLQQAVWSEVLGSLCLGNRARPTADGERRTKMNIYKVTYYHYLETETIVWLSNKREAQQYLTHFTKQWEELGEDGIRPPHIKEYQIKLNKTDVLKFLNFHCGGGLI